MVIIDRGGEVEIKGVSDFDLNGIFECGQCFRWDADENGVYTGVAFGRAAKLRRECGAVRECNEVHEGSEGGAVRESGAVHEGSVVRERGVVGERGAVRECNEDGSVFISGTLNDFETIWRRYFDLDRDYTEIRRRLCVDDFMRQATAFGAGIRMLQQDRWEALCSFIISQCNNIPRIKKIVAGLCRLFGDEFEFEGKTHYTFPSAGRLAPLSAVDLEPVRCGYRDEYIIGAARAVDSGSLDLDRLARLEPGEARAALKTLRGVGDKVADCTLLFGLNMLDAFPLDVWMKRAVAKHYGPEFDPVIFSPYAGIAQQYIFNYIRLQT